MGLVGWGQLGKPIYFPLGVMPEAVWRAHALSYQEPLARPVPLWPPLPRPPPVLLRPKTYDLGAPRGWELSRSLRSGVVFAVHGSKIRDTLLSKIARTTWEAVASNTPRWALIGALATLAARRRNHETRSR